MDDRRKNTTVPAGAKTVKEIHAWLTEEYQLDEESRQIFLEAFKESAIEGIKKMKECLDKGDLVCLGQAAHRIKGSLMQTGLTELGEIASEIEKDAKAGKEMDYAERYSVLEQAVLFVVKELG